MDWEVWAAIEDLYTAGKTRMIGISNVNVDQLSALCAKARTRPMMVQNRCYAVMAWDRDVRDLCRKHGILYQGFSLLTANMDVFNAPVFAKVAERVQAGVAQVVFRFAQQIGMLPLTGTTNPQHMKEDLACDQFTLIPQEVRAIEIAAI
jgi:diketogulonate reductase-like aldo/keto reductase